jgi:hypothetical protein
MVVGTRGTADKTSHKSADGDNVSDTPGNTSKDDPPSDSNSNQGCSSGSRGQPPSQVQNDQQLISSPSTFWNNRQSNHSFVEEIMKKGEIVQPDCYYSLLGVDVNASEHNIKNVYKRLAVRLHPDKNSHEDSPEAFRLL